MISELWSALSRPSRGRTRAPRTVPDRQRSRVYTWERLWILPHDPALLSLDECRSLIDRAYRWAEGPRSLQPGWAPPALTDGRGRRHACGSRTCIKLPRWARSRPIVLHECAHGLAPDKHGPLFVRCYVGLLERFAGFDRRGMEASLKSSGVRLADPLQPLVEPRPAPRRRLP